MDEPRWDPIVYRRPSPRYPCRIHGTTPCSSACRGKQERPTTVDPIAEPGSAGLAHFLEMRDADPAYRALMRGPRVPMHYLEPVEVIPLCMVRGIAKPRDVECRTTRSTTEVTCPQCVEALVSSHCRHRGGEEDCGPMCLLIFGDAFYTEMVDLPELGQRPGNYTKVPGDVVHKIRDEEPS